MFFRKRKIQRAAKAALQSPQSFLPQGVFFEHRDTETLRFFAGAEDTESS